MRRAKLFITILIVVVCATGLLYRAGNERRVSAASTTQNGVRLDLPANAQLRVENARGIVTVETWNEIYVWLETDDGGAQPAPVRIERDEGRLTIRTVDVEANNTNAPLVNLRLRMPLHAQVEIATGNGRIEIRGAPASLSANSETGDIRLQISPEADATITAQSRQGTVQSSFVSQTGSSSAPAREFSARLGAGNRIVRLTSIRGDITLTSLDATPSDEGTTASAREERRPPVLGGVDTTSPSGASISPTPTNSPEEVDEDDVVRIETDLVTLNVSVIDRRSRRGLTGLTADDFKCYEDGVEQQITNFESSSAPFDLVLLVDLSGSTREVVDLLRAATLRFVAASREQDRIAVIAFAGAPIIVSELTIDRVSLRERINRIEQPRGSTRLYDAVGFTMNFISAQRLEQPQRRSAIVLMSDGLDSSLPNVQGEGSTIAYEELARQVEEMDGVLYTLWLNAEYDSLSERDVQPETFDIAHDRMRALAEAGGGVFYEVEELEDLAGAYERVIADIGTVYSLSYRPTNEAHDGRFRTIRVTLPRNPDAVARGRRGYRAQNQ